MSGGRRSETKETRLLSSSDLSFRGRRVIANRFARVVEAAGRARGDGVVSRKARVLERTQSAAKNAEVLLADASEI